LVHFSLLDSFGLFVIVDVSEFACKVYNMKLGILRDWGIEGWAMILTNLFMYIICIALFTL